MAQYVCPKSEPAMYDMHIAFLEFRYIYIYIYVCMYDSKDTVGTWRGLVL